MLKLTEAIVIERSKAIANAWALEHQNHQEPLADMQSLAQKAYEQGMRDTFKMVVNILENPPMPQPMFQITLRAARISCGYSVEEAAGLLGIDSDTLNEFEKDSGEVPCTVVVKFRNLYGVSPDDIYVGPESDAHKHNRGFAQAENSEIAK